MRVDIALEVGSATESVTVSEQASLLKTESGEMSTTVEAQRMIDLGGLGVGGTFATSQGLRTYLSEIALVPGASNPASGFILGVRVNGAPNGTQRTIIDGADSTNQINSVQAGTGASMDAMQETAIQTSNFSAEFGQVGGGLFNITMRSGTNQYHGAGYDYLVNEAFNASTPFTNTLPRTRRNDYGFNLGGPVSDSENLQRQGQDLLLLQSRAVSRVLRGERHPHHGSHRGVSRGQFRERASPAAPPETIRWAEPCWKA